LRLVGRSYPDLALLTAGGGTITLTWAADLPPGARSLEFHNGYEPGRTVVQAAVLTARYPVPIGRIGHADDGRTLTAALNAAAGEPAATAPTDTGATSTDAASSDATAVATAGSAMFDALRRPLTSPWALAALLGACVLLGALHALTPGDAGAARVRGGRGRPRRGDDRDRSGWSALLIRRSSRWW
jgi:nickel/cobalt exporter